MNKYYTTEKGKEAVLRAVKKYNATEKGKEVHKKALLKYKATEKGMRTLKADSKRQNAKPENREKRRLWEASEEGKAKRKLIRERYNLKMKIKNAMNKLPFESKYILSMYLFLMYNILNK